MIVTNKLLKRIRTKRGGYTAIQRKVLGCHPAKKGWTKDVIGRDIQHWRILFYERDRKYPPNFVMPKFKSNWDWSRIKAKDNTYADTWKTRSMFLKGDYREFLNSEHWRKVKEKTKKKMHYYGQCKICGSTKNIELHHQSYNFVNTDQELLNIIPLCRIHHQEVHDYAKQNNISLKRATQLLLNKAHEEKQTRSTEQSSQQHQRQEESWNQ